MLADNLQTEPVQRADVRGVKQGELFLQLKNFRCLDQFLLQPEPDALPHFRRRRLGEGDHQNFFERHRIGWVEHQAQAALDQGARLAGARAGDDEHVAARGHGLLLLRGEVHWEKAPNSKLQHPEKLQTPSSQTTVRTGLELGD